MFTGIIEEIGSINKITRKGSSLQLIIKCSKVLEDVKVGDSISTNGVCLTVTSFTSETFTADLMPETVNLSHFKTAQIGALVNLERAMKVNGRFGGHMVAGHIDGTGSIKKISKDENAFRFFITCDQKHLRYIISKGSIAIDGISLTVTDVNQSGFEVSVIPQTMEETTLSKRRVAYQLNIETDIMGRYIEKFMNKNEGISKGFLAENGFL